MTVVAWVGGITALLAGTVAILQPDIKRVLAYSTVSQLGYMFLAVGIGAYSAAVFMVLCHAFYKGCLFLGAGSVIHGNHDDQDMRVMGRFRKFMPYTAVGMVVAWLAIAGVPPLSGFFSKDEIISQAFLRDDYGLWVIGIVAAGVHRGLHDPADLPHLLRQRALRGARPSISGGSGEDEPSTRRPPHTDRRRRRRQRSVADGVLRRPGARCRRAGTHRTSRRRIMIFPIMVLAVLAAIGGLMNLPFKSMELLDKWLEPSFRGVPEVAPRLLHRRSRPGAAHVRASRSCGIVLAYALYKKGLAHADRDPLNEKLGALAPVLGNAYYYDAGVSQARRRPRARRSRRGSTGWSTHKIIDGAVNGVGSLVRAPRRGLQQLQDGRVRRYALGITVGTVAAAALRRDLAGAVTGGLPDPLRHPDHAVRRRGDLPAAARRAARRRSRRSATPPWRSRSASPLYLLWQFDAQTSARSSSSRTSAGSPRIGVRYIVGVDGISLFMVVDHRAAVPDRPARVREVHRAPGQGVHRVVPDARGRDHGDLPLPRPHRVLHLLGAAARPDVLPHPGMGKRAPRVRGDEVLPLHRGGFGVPARVDARARVPAPGATPASSRSTTGCSREWNGLVGHHRAAALPRVHGRVRDQGAAVPVPHVAAPRAHRGTDRGLGGAGRRDHQDGRLRLRAVLVRAVPAGVGRPGADPAGARGDRDHLRRDRRRRCRPT